ncbi:MAG: hypothetical protein JOZ05_18210 [Acetobacteraceae bacterium]|nr:hypothetical protein [Acetobacteraceae bacterium]
MSDAAVAEIEHLFRCWLIRHELPDAYSRWRQAELEQAPMFAFHAVAADAKLLDRLGRAGAALAVHAELFAATVIKKREVSDAAHAAAQVVRQRIQHWRQRAASKPPPSEVQRVASPHGESGLAAKQLSLEQHLRIALDDHPFYRESTARALFRETLRLDTAGLQVIGAPFDAAMMLATTRYAARCWRGLVRGEVPTRNECMTAVALAQQWAARSGKNPFTVDLIRAGDGLEDLVVTLARDVATCLAIAHRFHGGPAAPGFAMWEEAEEYLSFAMLSVRPNVLSQMTLDQARSVAGAAARLASSALEDETVRLPAFPEGLDAISPRSVLAMTRFALPNGAERRRSERSRPDPQGALSAATVAALPAQAPSRAPEPRP